MSAEQVTNTKQASVDITDWHDLVRYVGREGELAAAAECFCFADDISLGEHGQAAEDLRDRRRSR